MTAVKQTYSREYKIAIDTLVITSEITDVDVSSVQKPPRDGAYIHGLYMEGARFDRKSKSMAESYNGCFLFQSNTKIF